LIAKTTSIRSDISIAILVGTLLTVVWIFFTWRYGFDIADEGYYWYGAQRMLLGEMPMRDFMAYDVGRYAWTGALMRVLGDDGIIGARMGAAVYQASTIVIGVLLVLRAADGHISILGKVIFAAVVTPLLNLWVYPYYKVFDYGTSILIVAMLALMLTSQSAKRWFGAGLILGMAAIMGRNHGVYGAFAGLFLLAFLSIKQVRPAVLVKPALAFVAGTIVGFSPTFVMAVLIDGFGSGFIASVRDLISSGATNLGLPVPWPWTVSKSDLGWLMWGTGVAKGLGFVAILFAPIAAIIALARKPLMQFRPVDTITLCASFAGIAYAHYAYSRADLTHLALSIFPLILILLSLGTLLGRSVVTSVILFGVSILTLAPEVPFLAQPLLNNRLVTISINGSTLHVFPGVDARLRSAEHVFAALPQARDSFLALPDAPALFAINKKKMQIWEIYSLWPRDPAFEALELARLQLAPPQVVFLSDHALDGRPELRYSSTHPVLYQWIVNNYQPAHALLTSPNQSWQVYVKVPLARRDIASFPQQK
jgi:hypothetical protein